MIIWTDRLDWLLLPFSLRRYIFAVLEGHVVPTVPYISDAATYSPESCVFGQLINIGSVLCESPASRVPSPPPPHLQSWRL